MEKRFCFEGPTAGKGFLFEQDENENLNAFSHPGSSGKALKNKTRAKSKELFLFEMLCFVPSETILRFRLPSALASPRGYETLLGAPQTWGSHGGVPRIWSHLRGPAGE